MVDEEKLAGGLTTCEIKCSRVTIGILPQIIETHDE